ncbi:MAG: T9SS type A sorting domain-containing protein [Bacteroidetes bacterium]|nr:T9SS type A sorting domain-containing protein [Bacteroidota bacterium]
MNTHILTLKAAFISAGLSAQLYTPSSADLYINGSNSNKIEHTGSDYWVNSNNTRAMYLMVGDGSSPYLYWVKDTFSNGFLLPLANNTVINTQSQKGDPDVVISANGVRAMAVFVAEDIQQNTRLYAQRYQRPNVTSTFWSYLGTPILITSGDASNPISCPNMDAGSSGRAVIVFQRADTIYCTTINIATGALSPAAPFAESIGFGAFAGYREPDVAIFSAPMAGTETVFITCTGTNYATEEILVHETTLNNLAAANTGGNTFTGLDNGLWGEFQYPRIAVHWTTSLVNANQLWTVTYHKKDQITGANDILAVVNHYGVISAPVYVNNVNPQDRLTVNQTPCVAYSGKYIVICWAFADAQGTYGLDNLDILVRKYNLDGVVETAWQNSYSLVNSDIAGGQYSPSVTDCRIGDAQNGDTRFCWYQHDETAPNTLAFRKSNFTRTNLRQTDANDSAKTAVLRIYPQPASDVIYFQSAPSPEAAFAFYNSSGMLVRIETVTGNDSGIYQICTADLPAGIYIAEMRTALAREKIKFIISK